MTAPEYQGDEATGRLEARARAAAAGLRQVAELRPPDFADVTRTRRVRKVGQAASLLAGLVVLAAVGFGAGSVADPTGLRWLIGAILVALVAAAWLLCAHAGGHALFVPLPAAALLFLWALTVHGEHDETGWWLVALSAAAAGIGGTVGASALRQRLRGASLPLPTLVGMSGLAVTPLRPAGVVQVASETWTAVSLSGPLPVGAPVHVVRRDGVRLEVWSEAGTVPDQRTLEAEEGPQ
jgi:membrane-bound ClpP family serine protease